MILSKLKLDEETELEFALQVFGTHEPADDIRLVIKGESYDVLVRGSLVNENVRFTVPKMKNILESGVHDVQMEILIDGKVFTPLNESIEFEPLVELDVKKSTSKAIREEVSVKPISVTTTSENKNKIDEVLAEGYELETYAGVNVMVKQNRYYGIVSESKIVRSEFAYTTIEELVTALTK